MWIRCYLHGESVPAVWGADFFVLEAYRGRGFGRDLLIANQSAYDLVFSLAMADLTRIIKKKVGALEFHSLPLLARLNRVDPQLVLPMVDRSVRKRTTRSVGKTVRWMMKWSQVGRMVAAWMTYRLRRKRKLAQREAPPSEGLRFEPITGRFDARADALWERARVRYDFAVERDAAYLNWKFRDQPWMDYRAAYALRGPEVVGLAVYRKTKPPEPPAGIIAELISADGSPVVYGALAEHAAAELERAGAGLVIVGASDDVLRSALEDIGFFVYDEFVPMVSGVRSDLVSQVTEAQRVLLSYGDHDVDQYPITTLPSLSKLLGKMGSR
jgi:hypothetical protein